jgi:hypothetical protein
MFDIVSAYQHELPLPIEIESIHDAKPGLARPAPSRHVQASSER